MKRFALLIALSILSLSLFAAENSSSKSASLDDLLNKVKAIAKQETADNKQREAHFLKEKNQ